MRRAADWTAVMIRQPESWAHRKLAGEWQWGLLENQLLAARGDPLGGDQLALANCQRSEDGQKNRNKPRPIPRPGVDEYDRKKETLSMSVDRFDEELQRIKEAVQNG